MSKQKHLKKYAQLYTDQGFDVLTVSVTPWQVIWPKQGTQVNLLIFLLMGYTNMHILLLDFIYLIRLMNHLNS